MKKKIKILPIDSNNINNAKSINASKTVHSSILNIIKISHNNEKYKSRTLISRRGRNIIIF